MILTPEKARDKVCPMKFAAIGILTARGAVGLDWPDTVINRRSSEQETCSADSCMAWRWAGSDGTGFCGMAGTPDGLGPGRD